MKKKINGIIEMLLDLPPDYVKPEHKMEEDLGIDDLDMTEVKYFLEEDLSLILEETYPTVEDYETVQDLYNKLEKDNNIKLEE